jgi:hypothetical protein
MIAVLVVVPDLAVMPLEHLAAEYFLESILAG